MPEGPGDLSGNSFLIWVLSSIRVSNHVIFVSGGGEIDITWSRTADPSPLLPLRNKREEVQKTR